MPLAPATKRRHLPSKGVAATQVSTLTPIPAPIGGINYRDNIMVMPPQDAVSLTDVLCRTNGVELRPGWREHVTGLSQAGNTNVSTLLPYIDKSSAANNKLFAALGTSIYDVTASTGSPGAAVQVTAASNGIWSHTMFSNTADGVFLCLVNNGGGYYTFNTVAGWQVRTLTGGPANINNITSITAMKGRLWFTFEGDSSFYYLAIGAVTGALSAFALGPWLKHGGALAACTTWTQDGGTDIRDFPVFIGSQGDVIVYDGFDPSSAATWSQVGAWYIGRVPVNDKFHTRVGADTFVLSEQGIVPLSMLVGGRWTESVQNNPITSKIQNGLIPEVSGSLSTLSWELQVLPKLDSFMIKQPVTTNGTHRQWMRSLTTGAWSLFNGIEMLSTVLFDGTFYFGRSDGIIGVGLEEGFDTDHQLLAGTAGAVIEGDSQPAFIPYGTSGQLKTFHAARMIFVTTSAPSVAVQMNTQFNTDAIPGSPAFVPGGGARWDAAFWNQAFWAGSSSTFEVWAGLVGVGYFGSLRTKVRGLPGTSWSGAHVLHEPGGMM